MQHANANLSLRDETKTQKIEENRFFPLNPLVLIFRSPSWHKPTKKRGEEKELPKQESPGNRSFSQPITVPSHISARLSRTDQQVRIFSEPSQFQGSASSRRFIARVKSQGNKGEWQGNKQNNTLEKRARIVLRSTNVESTAEKMCLSLVGNTCDERC